MALHYTAGHSIRTEIFSVENMLKIAVVGGANLDLTGQSSNAIRQADSNPGTIGSAAGGVGRNIAEDLARLGINTALITMLGDDVGKTVVLNSCFDAGIDCDGFIIDKNHSTGTYLAITDEQGNLNVAVADMAIHDHFGPEVLATRSAQLAAADAIVIEANLPLNTIQWLAENFAHKPIYADCVSAAKAQRLQPILSKLDVLKVNRAEAMQLLGLAKSNVDDQTLAKLLFELGVKQVLLSLGAQGALLYCESGVYRQPAFATEVKSDNGAGDALLAGFIGSTVWLKQPQQQLAFAVACAAFTLQSAHAVNPAIGKDAIKNQYLTQIPPGAWY